MQRPFILDSKRVDRHQSYNYILQYFMAAHSSPPIQMKFIPDPIMFYVACVTSIPIAIFAILSLRPIGAPSTAAKLSIFIAP